MRNWLLVEGLNNELYSTENELVLTFEVLHRHLPEEVEENYETLHGGVSGPRFEVEISGIWKKKVPTIPQ
jgi:hypothetical protein